MSIAQFVAVGGEVIEYRVVPGSERAVVVMHGGHMHAGIELGEQVFRDMGYTVIVPSRPGYGNTPAISGGDRTRFADAVAELVAHLGCGEVAAVVGISAGGPSAITLASRHRQLVRRVVLENSISDLPWPDRRTRLVAKIVFGPKVERVAWAATRLCLRVAPRLGLHALMFSLTTRPTRDVVREFDRAEREALVRLFCEMRSGRGFGLDLETTMTIDELESVAQPCLVLASANDGSVGLHHAESLDRHLSAATLSINRTSSHLMWFGPARESIPQSIRQFLTS